MQNDLWFGQLDSFSLCRGGGNGPNHPSQLYAIEKYVKENETFLDMGCGSGTTYEALQKAKINVKYVGIDMIDKNIAFCKKTFPTHKFFVDNAADCNFGDKIFDVTYSRHLLEHLPSFEVGLLEQTRISKRLVIIVLWASLLDGDENNIKNIEENGKTYTTEYTNRYSRSKVMESINKLTDWKLIEFSEGIGKQVRGNDTIIVMERRGNQ